MFQLLCYHKQETLILFEEYFHTIYKQRVAKFYLSHFRQYIQLKRVKREKATYTVHVLKCLKLQKILNYMQNLKVIRVLKAQRLD